MEMSPSVQSSSARRVERRAEGRVLAGVCRGLAEHLGLDVMIVRLAFALLIGVAGVGTVAYAALWVLVPKREEAGSRDWPQAFAYAALTAGLAIFSGLSGLSGLAILPIVVIAIGAAILWQQADSEMRQRWVKSTMPLKRMWLRSVLGMLLVTGGIGFFVVQNVKANQVSAVLVATGIMLSGVAVIATPWVMRLWTDLDIERRERIRSQERAELAAHVHDSVLHTLTLIQRSAHDPREVARLARSQERELRTWLYAPRADPDQTFAAAVQKIVGEVEDRHGVPIEVVCVGDTPLDERLAATLQAAREAMVNAVKYAESPTVSVYAEVEGDEVTIFVRDRGRGFDMDRIPDDRMGLRGSIIGRMERNGGKATIRTAPGEGTEVRLEIKLETKKS
jgi:signal transduction histidine kinase